MARPRVLRGGRQAADLRRRKDYKVKANGDRSEVQRCVDVDCLAYLNGWITRIDEGTQLGQAQAYYIRHQSGRRYSEDRDDAGLTVFRFRSGQRCFREHRAPLYLVRTVDKQRRHTRGVDWLEDFHEHTDRIIQP